MSVKTKRVIETTCDRCGGVENITYETKGPHDSPPPSSGLFVIVHSDDEIDEVLKRFKTKDFPDSAPVHEARLSLCVDCRKLFAEFIENKPSGS